MKTKKIYAVKEDAGRTWKCELDPNQIKSIKHYGAGSEMCNDRITIELEDYCELEVDAVIFE